MKAGVWKALGAVSVLCMIAVVAVSAVMGGCDKMIECTSGMMPMKCHWTFVAATFVGVAGVVSAIAALAAKTAEGRRVAALMTIVVGAIIAVLPMDFAIGLCGNAEMECHHTALVVWIAVAVAVVVALVQVAKANPADAEKPKLKL
ncbi:MAG: DUF4418 family protein [Eggerthellaceae bacterium]|nr:DUF4418 family protein [Eggerthellaceae bacterium]